MNRNVIPRLHGVDGPCQCPQGACLLMSCRCLVSNRKCGPLCGCHECENVIGNDDQIAVAQRRFFISGEGDRALVVKRRPCSCVRKCLACTCECFQYQSLCTPDCGCGRIEACKNTEPSLIDGTIESSRSTCLRYNVRAFDPKFVDEGDAEPRVRATHGCSCTLVACSSNKCICVWGSVPCTPTCRCTNCRNPNQP